MLIVIAYNLHCWNPDTFEVWYINVGWDQAGVELFYGVTAGIPYIWHAYDICQYKRVKFSKNNNKINEKEENTSKENNRTPPPSRYNKLCPEQKVYYSTTPNPIVKLRLFHTKTNPKHPKI